MCMQRQDRKELLPFDLEPERTLHRLRREAHTTQFKIMQNQEDEGQFQERNEPQVDQNGQNYRDQATRSFVQPEELCEELLGVTPPTDSLRGSSIFILWLCDQLSTSAPNADEVTLERSARGFIIALMRTFLFVDKKGVHVHLCFLPLSWDLK